MEISFTHTAASCYREVASPVCRVQETAESVVPDTDPDIGRVVSVRTNVLLKSKDLTSRGVQVTGEMQAALLYITESETAVSCVQLRREFSMDFELGQIQAEALTQIRLSVASTEARVLNPRKVAVTAELVGELRCYRQEELMLETLLPENAEGLVHVKRETAQSSAVSAVTEKTFAVSEQFRFPEAKGEPARLLSQEVGFTLEEVQQVGSRAVVKGTAVVTVYYLSKDADYPLRAQFSAPFSQIVDTGTASEGTSSAHVELTSAYFDLIDTISGEKALDVELHALLELVSREELNTAWFSDAYCNRMPCACLTQTTTLTTVAPAKKLRLDGEGLVSIAEDCEDVLCVLPFLAQLTRTENELSALTCLDVLYRSKGGGIAAVRRLFELEKGEISPATRLGDGRLCGEDFRPEGTSLRARLSLEVQTQNVETREITALTGVTLDEDAAWRPESLPNVTLVRNGEALWELAKRCHSSVGAIEALNGETIHTADALLLIPREN